MTTPWLSDEEVADLCDGLIQPAAQIRYIEREYGIKCKRKPSGKPVVMRTDLEPKERKAANEAGFRGPNVTALRARFSRGG